MTVNSSPKVFIYLKITVWVGCCIVSQYWKNVMSKVQRGIYRHYKGNYYEVIDIARHSETLEHMVVYRALYGNFELWIRPFKMFFETIKVNGKHQKRFEFKGTNV